MKKYRLLKDINTPATVIKAGEIFTYNEDGYEAENHPIIYAVKYVENKPDWFGPVQPERICIGRSGSNAYVFWIQTEKCIELTAEQILTTEAALNSELFTREDMVDFGLRLRAHDDTFGFYRREYVGIVFRNWLEVRKK